mgnify:CR=1 FL=1
MRRSVSKLIEKNIYESQEGSYITYRVQIRFNDLKFSKNCKTLIEARKIKYNTLIKYYENKLKNIKEE